MPFPLLPSSDITDPLQTSCLPWRTHTPHGLVPSRSYRMFSSLIHQTCHSTNTQACVICVNSLSFLASVCEREGGGAMTNHCPGAQSLRCRVSSHLITSPLLWVSRLPLQRSGHERSSGEAGTQLTSRSPGANVEVGFQLQPWALAHVCVPCTLPVLGFSQALRNPHTFDIKALKIKFKNLSFLLYSLLPFHHLSSSIYLLVGQSFILVLPKLLKEKPNKPFGQPDICLSIYLPTFPALLIFPVVRSAMWASSQI